MPAPRPVSPFLILLLGGAATALGAEWLRFQWSPVVAAIPASLGAAATLVGVARAYTARRAWRRGPPASAPGATTAADAAAAHGAAPGDDEGSLRVRRLDGTSAHGERSVDAPGFEDAPRAPAAPPTAADVSRAGPEPRTPREAPADRDAHEPAAPLRR